MVSEIVEYKILGVWMDNDKRSERDLNNYADDGWRVVCQLAKNKFLMEREKNG